MVAETCDSFFNYFLTWFVSDLLGSVDARLMGWSVSQYSSSIEYGVLGLRIKGVKVGGAVEDFGFARLEKGWRGDLIALYSFVRRVNGEGGAECYSLVSSNRTYVNGW